MLVIKGLRNAERLVKEQKELGNDVRWDGWNMVFFRPSEQGQYSKDGAFRNGQWGFDNRSNVTLNGTWEIDPRNLKKRNKKTIGKRPGKNSGD